MKYTTKEIKDKINALNNGWDKTVDDIFQDMGFAYEFRIDQDATTRYGTLKLWRRGYTDGRPPRCYKSQCEKMKVFKEELLLFVDTWYKTSELNEIKEEMVKLNERLKQLEEKTENEPL